MILSVMFAGGLGCASRHFVPLEVFPADENSAALAITIERPERSWLGSFAINDGTLVAVYFIRVEDGKLLAPRGFMRSDWIPRDWIPRTRAYYFNAAPGEYAAVAADFWTQNGEDSAYWTEYFPLEVIEASRTVVVARELGFMGRYRLSSTGGKGDAAQEHYKEKFTSGTMLSFLADTWFDDRKNAKLLESHDDDDARAEFLEGARLDLGATAWRQVLPEWGGHR